MNVVETRVAVVRLNEGILEHRFHHDVTLTIEDANAIVDASRALVSEPTPTLAVAHRIRGATRDVRALVATSKAFSDIASRFAMVVQSPVSRLLGNTFFGLNRPPFPTRMFTSEDEAVAWLRCEESAP